MSRQTALDAVNRGPDDQPVGPYISGADVRELVNTIYDDFGDSAIRFKGGNISAWNYGAYANIPLILSDIASSGLNCVTVPIRVTAANINDSSPEVDLVHMAYAKSVVASLPAGVSVIAEPYPWVNNGNQSETLWVPSNPALWHTKWRQACVTVAENFPTAAACYIGSNIVSMEGGYNSEWDATVNAVRAVTDADISYRCNWWYTSERLNLLKSWPLLGAIDLISVAAYFELTATPSPAIDEIEACLTGTLLYDRGQDVVADVTALHEAHNRPVFFGELNCSHFTSALSAPWNPDTSAVVDPMIQRRMFTAYMSSFSDLDWWQGFSIFNIGGFQDSGYVLSRAARTYLKKIPTL